MLDCYLQLYLLPESVILRLTLALDCVQLYKVQKIDDESVTETKQSANTIWNQCQSKQVTNVTDVCFFISTQNYFANSNNTSITVPVLNEEP